LKATVVRAVWAEAKSEGRWVDQELPLIYQSLRLAHLTAPKTREQNNQPAVKQEEIELCHKQSYA